MKIAFDFITDETPLFVEAGKVLENEGHEVSGLTLGKRWRTLWEGRFRTAPISAVSRNGKHVRDEPHVSREFDRIEREYGQFNPSSFLHADRFIYQFSRQHQMAMLIDTFRHVEDFFRKESPDIYFCTPIAYLFNLVTHAVCKRLGIPHISIYVTRGAVPRFTYTTGVSFRWDLVSDTYRKHVSGMELIDDVALTAAGESLRSFRSSPHRPYYMKTARINYRFRAVFLKEFFTRLRYYYIDGWGQDEADYMTRTPFWYAYRDSKRLLRAKLFSLYKDRIFDTPEQGPPYYLFPLNVQPEAATLIYSEWYVDLISTIQNISRCIPLGAYLYVKEHTSAFGRRGSGFYKEIKKLHNVRLLGPWENTDALIVDSNGVIVLSSTMGWESLLHGRPVYVLGNLFCNDISPDIKVEGYDNLRLRLYSDFHKGERGPIVSDDALAAFMAAMQKSSFPGMFGPAKLDIRDAVLSKDNVHDIVAGFKSIIQRQYNKTFD